MGPPDFREMAETDKYGAFAIMNSNPKIVKLLQFLFTNEVMSLPLASGSKVDEITGRISLLFDIIHNMEVAEDNLLDVKKIQGRKNKTLKIRNTIKSKLLWQKDT